MGRGAANFFAPMSIETTVARRVHEGRSPERVAPDARRNHRQEHDHDHHRWNASVRRRLDHRRLDHGSALRAIAPPGLDRSNAEPARHRVLVVRQRAQAGTPAGRRGGDCRHGVPAQQRRRDRARAPRLHAGLHRSAHGDPWGRPADRIPRWRGGGQRPVSGTRSRRTSSSQSTSPRWSGAGLLFATGGCARGWRPPGERSSFTQVSRGVWLAPRSVRRSLKRQGGLSVSRGDRPR